MSLAEQPAENTHSAFVAGQNSDHGTAEASQQLYINYTADDYYGVSLYVQKCKLSLYAQLHKWKENQSKSDGTQNLHKKKRSREQQRETHVHKKQTAQWHGSFLSFVLWPWRVCCVRLIVHVCMCMGESVCVQDRLKWNASSHPVALLVEIGLYCERWWLPHGAQSYTLIHVCIDRTHTHTHTYMCKAVERNAT